MCVCVREREKKKYREKEPASDRTLERERVCARAFGCWDGRGRERELSGRVVEEALLVLLSQLVLLLTLLTLLTLLLLLLLL